MVLCSIVVTAVEEVKATLASCEGPMLNNVTKADFVKFHDDKEQWTGAQGGEGGSCTGKAAAG